MVLVKEKKCKGTGLAKGYGCGKLTKHRIYGLGKMCCYTDWLLNSENGKIKLAKATLQVTKPRKELHKAMTEKKERQSLTSLLNSTKTICHEYIRKRDIGKPCISCGSPYSGQEDAGHFYSGGKFSSIKFDEDNIHSQCIQCNRFKEGMHEDYRLGLINRFGKEFVDKLDQKAEQYKQSNFKWNRQMLIEIKEYYKQKLKEWK